MRISNYLMYLEDDPVELMKFKMAFDKFENKIEIKSFQNGLDGWEYLVSNTNNLPRIVVLDLKMPIMNGFEFLKKLKNNLSFRKIPVVVLTTSNDQNDILYSYDHQVAGYFVKPFSTDQYNEIILKINQYWHISKIPQ